MSGISGTIPNRDFAITRYDTFGKVDNSFGEEGKVITDFGEDDLLLTSTIQSDGKFLCAGNTLRLDNSVTSALLLARYRTDIQTSTIDIPNILDKVNIFPNPSNGQFTLSFNLATSSNISIDLFSVNGIHIRSIISNEFFSEGKNTFHTTLSDKVVSGIYIVRIKTDKGVVNQKVVVER